MIVVDTLRADHVGALATGRDGQRDATPRLDRFAGTAAVYRRAWTPAPFTMPAMAAVMTGAWPDRTGVLAHEPGVSLHGWPGRTLAESAQRSGLATAAVVANPWLARTGTGFERGFDVFSRLHRSGQVPAQNAATAVTDEAIRLLDGLAGRRFLLWVHYFDPHMPYDPPRRFAEAAGASSVPSRVMTDFGAEGRDLARLFRAEDQDGKAYRSDEVEQARRLYEGEVRYVDDEVGRLLDHVDELGLAPGTLVVVASDHGESLGEHGLYFSHDYTLHEELVRAVLMIRGPRLAAGPHEEPVSLVDLAPTLCRLAALDCDVAADGRDLFSPSAGPRTLFAAATPRRSKGTPFERLDVDGPAGRWTMALRGSDKLLRMPSTQGTTFNLYDLDRDPGETRDLAGNEDAGSRRRELEAQLDAWIREMDAARPQSTSHARRRAGDTKTLRSLGYLQ